jgi:hypothetical protein
MNIRVSLFTALLMCSACTRNVRADESGWVPIRVTDNATSHCINRSTEAVSIDLKRVITDKESGWFKEGKRVDLVADVSLTGRTNGNTKSVALPRAYSDSLEGFPGGRFSVGDEENLVSEYPLTDGTEKLTNIHIDVSVANEIENTALTDVLLGIADSVPKLPMPAQALTALDAADSITSNILSRVKQDSNSEGNFAKQAALQFNFSENGTCSGTDDEYTGTKALLRSGDGTEDQGVVPIDKATAYCYRSVTDQVYGLTFAAKQSDGTCPANAKAYVDVGNPYILFYVNADPVSRSGRGRTPIAMVAANSAPGVVAYSREPI